MIVFLQNSRCLASEIDGYFLIFGKEVKIREETHVSSNELIDPLGAEGKCTVRHWQWTSPKYS
jgi:hypothetical protein